MDASIVDDARLAKPLRPCTARKQSVVRFDNADLIATAARVRELRFGTTPSAQIEDPFKDKTYSQKPPRSARNEGRSRTVEVSNGASSSRLPKNATAISTPRITIVSAEQAENAIMTEDEDSPVSYVFDRRSTEEREADEALEARVEGLQQLRLFLLSSRHPSIQHKLHQYQFIFTLVE